MMFEEAECCMIEKDVVWLEPNTLDLENTGRMMRSSVFDLPPPCSPNMKRCGNFTLLRLRCGLMKHPAVQARTGTVFGGSL